MGQARTAKNEITKCPSAKTNCGHSEAEAEPVAVADEVTEKFWLLVNLAAERTSRRLAQIQPSSVCLSACVFGPHVSDGLSHLNI